MPEREKNPIKKINRRSRGEGGEKIFPEGPGRKFCHLGGLFEVKEESLSASTRKGCPGGEAGGGEVVMKKRQPGKNSTVDRKKSQSSGGGSCGGGAPRGKMSRSKTVKAAGM